MLVLYYLLFGTLGIVLLSKKIILKMTEKLKEAWTGEKATADVCADIAAEMNAALAEE